MMPKIELIKINNEAEVTIYLGLPALIKNNIGLKKIPPPIPATPEINPRTAPINIETSVNKAWDCERIFNLFAGDNCP